MKILTQIRFYLVIVTLSFLGLLINYLNQNEKLTKVEEELTKCRTDKGYISGGDISKSNAIDSISAIADSLRDELFMERVDAGRHEITREEVLGKYPKIAKEYDEFYSHQTE